MRTGVRDSVMESSDSVSVAIEPLDIVDYLFIESLIDRSLFRLWLGLLLRLDSIFILNELDLHSVSDTSIE